MTDTYEVTAPTEEQLSFLRERFKVERLDAKTYNVLVPEEDVNAFVEWADRKEVTYRLI